jgi:hypothetical protein
VPDAERTVARLKRDFRLCHQRTAAYWPEAQGRISLELWIDDSGQVSRLGVRDSGTLPRETVRCVTQAARLARFEPAVGGAALLHVPVQLVAQRASSR